MKNLLLLILFISCVGCTAQKTGLANVTERNGKIGIGTSFPDELLTVKGKIHTQEVLVDLQGAVAPDYVFENYYNGTSLLKPNYKFPSLTEVASFIEANHHLEGIPSAKEIEEKGLSLKEMNLLLLQKVEELTIYTIEQQQEINELKEKIDLIVKEN